MSSRIPTQARPSVEQLGTVQQEYKATFGRFIVLAVIILVVVLVFLLAVAGASNSLFPLLIGSAIACVVFIGVMVLVLIRPRLSVIQCEKGLAIYRGNELVAVVPWDNVAHVQQVVVRHSTDGVPTGTTYRYSIQTTDGRSFSFSNIVLSNTLRDVRHLGERIQQATFPLILARTLTALNAGQPVQFGTLSVSQTGLSTKGVTIPWSEVSGARVTNGRIQIQRAGHRFNWANLSVGQTPDALVLIALLNQLTSFRDL